MEKENQYLDINKLAWNNKTPFHVNSAFYDMPAFLNGKSTLNSIEMDLLGDMAGKKILHLQCHFGQDTISLARFGAQVTGVDFSEAAIEKAQELATATGVPAKFICCDVYDLPNHLDEEFDIVFTSYGTIGWLPDLDKWAAVIHRFLRPGGRFIFAEFHPVVWMMDTNLEKIGYSYFNHEAIRETEMGTYADVTAPIETVTITWNHSMAEVLGSLLQNGLQLKEFNEYDFSPYNCFHNMEEFEPGRYRVAHLGNKLPLVYSLAAVKNNTDI